MAWMATSPLPELFFSSVWLHSILWVILQKVSHWHARSAVAPLFFSFIAPEFLLRFAYDPPIRHSNEGGVIKYRGVVDRDLGLMILSLSTITWVLLLRSVYRTIELSEGWTGAIISTQWLFSSSCWTIYCRRKVLIIVHSSIWMRLMVPLHWMENYLLPVTIFKYTQ